MNKQISQKTQERRRYHRYDASNISITLKPSEDLPETESLNIIDFNRYGLALFSNQHFKVGDTLNLALSNKSGHDIEIMGFVCNRAPSDGNFRYGLRFIETDASDKKQAALFEMEQALESLAS